MSAGRFARFKYECDDGTIKPIRLQPETVAATFDSAPNAQPSGDISSNERVKVSKGRNEIGTGPRYVVGEWDGAPPTGYDDRGTVKITVLQKAVFDAILLLGPMSYLGATLTVIRKVEEDVR